MPNTKITGNIVGHRIQKSRKEAPLTQLELSAILDVDYGIDLSPVLISKIESGRRPVRDKELHAICKILKVSPDTVFGWK